MSLMACAAAAVAETASRLGYELPIVTIRVEGQAEVTVSRGAAYHLVGSQGQAAFIQAGTAGAHDKLADAKRVGCCVRRLGVEAFEVVVMSVKDHIRPIIV